MILCKLQFRFPIVSRCAASLMLLLVPMAGGSELVDHFDLHQLLTDPAKLENLIIEYDTPDHVSMFLYGTGSVAKQVRPPLTSSLLVPTCRGKVERDAVKEVVAALMAYHFFELPSRQFWYATASDDEADFWQEVQLHTITLDDGTHQSTRAFAAGKFMDKKETIPSDFAAVEVILQRIGKSATEGKPCRVAPAVKLPPSTEPKVPPEAFRG